MDELLVDLLTDLGRAIVFTRGAQLTILSGTYHLDILYGLSADGYNIFHRDEFIPDRFTTTTYCRGPYEIYGHLL